MNQAFSQLDKRQLNNIRTFRAENIAPVTQQSHTCVYLFSGPDFLYADAMFSDCSTFVLQGLEPVSPVARFGNGSSGNVSRHPSKYSDFS